MNNRQAVGNWPSCCMCRSVQWTVHCICKSATLYSNWCVSLFFFSIHLNNCTVSLCIWRSRCGVIGIMVSPCACVQCRGPCQRRLLPNQAAQMIEKGHRILCSLIRRCYWIMSVRGHSHLQADCVSRSIVVSRSSLFSMCWVNHSNGRKRVERGGGVTFDAK